MNETESILTRCKQLKIKNFQLYLDEGLEERKNPYLSQAQVHRTATCKLKLENELYKSLRRFFFFKRVTFFVFLSLLNQFRGCCGEELSLNRLYKGSLLMNKERKSLGFRKRCREERYQLFKHDYEKYADCLHSSKLD